jgi:mono/diheme cytochrome c family protein
MRFLAVIGFLAIIAAIAAAVFFFGGYYNVAATSENPAAVDWALIHVREASIAKHADAKPPSNLNDAAFIQSGARAFSERGCVDCHGGPGVDEQKFADAINPGPPDLKDVVPNRQPQELFWVIKNGINMTAMPGFGSVDVGDQEIWSIVAFLRKLPIVSAADYKSWTATPATPPDSSPAAPAPASAPPANGNP